MSLNKKTRVNVVIPIHSSTRPIVRAVRSVLDGTKNSIKIIIVVHNMELEPILKKLGPLKDDTRIRVEHLIDNKPSPSGPKNYGLELVDADYVCLLDSDDTLQPGALDTWLESTELKNGISADMVIAPTTNDQNFKIDGSPPIRTKNLFNKVCKVLDSYHDRLVYRAAPLGLIKTEKLNDLRLAADIPTGEDQPFTARIWSKPDMKIVFPLRAPAYVEHSDQNDRVTATPRPVNEEFLYLGLLLDEASPWMQDDQLRLAITLKQLRVHLFDSVRNRVVHSWDETTVSELRHIATRIIETEPKALSLLSKNDAKLLDAVFRKETDIAKLQELLTERSNYRSFGSLTPAKLKYLFHPHSPLRYHLAGFLLSKTLNNKR